MDNNPFDVDSASDVIVTPAMIEAGVAALRYEIGAAEDRQPAPEWDSEVVDRVYRVMARLTATLSVWRPIETAPKDGAHILLYSDKAAEDPVCVGHFYKLMLTPSERKRGVPEWSGFLCVPDGTAITPQPTAWMPLPPT